MVATQNCSICKPRHIVDRVFDFKCNLLRISIWGGSENYSDQCCSADKSYQQYFTSIALQRLTWCLSCFAEDGPSVPSTLNLLSWQGSWQSSRMRILSVGIKRKHES